MQNKGVIRFIAISLALVVTYYLFFTYKAASVRQDANEYAEEYVESLKSTQQNTSEEELKEAFKNKKDAYLDSISGEVVYNFMWLRDFTYREVQEREINLGLDLKGGMNVILEISVADVIKALSGNSNDPDFVAALEKAKEYQKETQEDFVTLFGRAYSEIAPEGRLSTIFSTKDMREKVNFNSTNDVVLKVIRQETDGAISNAFNVLRNRIDRFGVAQPVIQPLETDGQILIELPGVKDPERVRKLLKGTAKLQFWETYDNRDVYPFLYRANEKLRNILALEEEKNDSLKAETAVAEKAEEVKADQKTDESLDLLSDGEDLLSEDSTLVAEDTTAVYNESQMRKQFPLFAILQVRRYQNSDELVPGASVGYSHFSDTALVNKYLNMPEIKEIFPRSMRIKFLWSVKPLDEEGNIFELVALRVTNMDGEPALSGDVITDARSEFGNTGSAAEVTMSMNSEGAKKWARLTRNNIGKQIAIVLDNYVYSYPNVNQEIPNGRSSITGNFTVAEAKDLANVLKSGKLPAPAHIIQEEIVGPSLGQESIQKGLWSFLIAFLVVMVYMILYYRHAGWVANLALVVNLFFITGILASLGAALTLPGIACIVLTIGMSVDANVLIYERIKEEMNAGKGLRVALSDGYKNAYSAIIDANLTTLLTAIILGYFGKGPIYGFAITLGIGIITSLFSAIFITRLIYEGMLGNKKNISFATKLTQNAFQNTNIKFIEKRKLAYVISGILIVISLSSLFTRGLNLGVDFTGGHTYIVRFAQDVSVNDVKKSLGDVYGEMPEVKTFGSNNQIKVTTKYLIDDNYELTDADKNVFYEISGVSGGLEVDVDDVVEAKLYEGLKPYLGDIDYKTFVSDQDKNIGRMSSQKVGPTIADDIKTSAYYAVIFSLLIIFLYILIRFSNWQFGLGAVVALAHDVLIILGIYSLFYSIMPFSMEIDQSFIAAILTVVGYSINDTVVVFDRIREYIGLYKKRDRTEIMDSALNSTMSRTFSTSLSTFVVLLTIFIFGGEMIRGFIFAMLVGVVVGTYSSLFIATPVVYDTVKADENKRALKGVRRS
ncbi:MAG: protein translocase subunit SecDF [Salinivirgaceae bacterium]|nr:MAG: protein translocase subunit SecDF [Salinivirgaceae bacterium]